MIVEDAADTAGLAPVLQEEVFIAPGLEHLEVGRIDAVAGAFEGAMKMLGILQKGVVGGEIGATTEPPHWPGLEIAVIEMDCRYIGITRVQHHRGAGGEPALPLGLRPLTEDRRRQLFPLHLRKIDAALLEEAARLHHPRAATPTFRPLPALLLEAALAVELLKARADRILQTQQQRPGPGTGIGGRHRQRFGRQGVGRHGIGRSRGSRAPSHVFRPRGPGTSPRERLSRQPVAGRPQPRSWPAMAGATPGSCPLLQRCRIDDTSWAFSPFCCRRF